MQISEAQSRAIAHGAGPAMVLAGPGSGKTLVIVNRINYLIRRLGVRPEEILVITFTKAAAMEMRERFERLMGGKSRVAFGTFHAVFFQILKYAYHYSAENILREDQKYRILSELVRSRHLEYEDEKEFLAQLGGEISMVKNEQIPLEHFYSKLCSEEAFRSIFQGYQDRLQRSRLLDFDDMLVYCYELFCQRSDILAQWQNRFRYILVDEFQDINQLQYRVVRQLAGQQANLFVVGDDDQSIYRFRGAKPEIMLHFQKDYPNAAVMLLDMNFRSTSAVSEAAGRVIAENKHRFSKQIRTLTPGGHPVELRAFRGQEQEDKYLIGCIRAAAQRGVPYGEMAVLTRTNTGGRHAAERLMEYQIPFRMRDRLPSLYEHWIAADVLAYLRLALGVRDRKDFLQVMNRPKRYIGRECVDEAVVSFERLRTWYDDKPWMVDRLDRMEADLARMRSMTPFAAINFIRRGIDYESYLKEYASARSIRQEELLEILEELQESAAGFPTIRAWFAHIEEYQKLLEEQKRSRMEEAAQEDAVVLSTLHSSKGLEFDEVFILDVNDQIIPHQKAYLEADIEEERRLLYVGMTRAKRRLHLFYIRERYGRRIDPSPFLEVFESAYYDG